MTKPHVTIHSNAKWGGKALATVLFACLVLLSFVATLTEAIPAPGSSSSSGMVLRVRLADGSMEKIQLEEGSEETLTLGDVLKPFGVPSDASVRIGTKTTTNTKDELQALQVRHGSMITVLPPKTKDASASTSPGVSRFAARRQKSAREWDPYPDLAKDYDAVLRQTKHKQLSYSDISKIQSALHVVEPQKEGPILRLYMCKVSAERFYGNGVVTNKQKRTTTLEPRFGLLLGTIQRERVDRKPKKARTSLSSQTSDSEYCTVAKVQALWEPPGQKPQPLKSSSRTESNTHQDDTIYEAGVACQLWAKNPKVLELAECLGLTPVGWIFSYKDDRLADENSFGTDGPQALFGMDVAIGGKLKLQAMKERQRVKAAATTKPEEGEDLNPTGDRFVTLAMDATTGATEAFQLSDVSVQMVHEDVFEKLLEPLQAPSAATSSKKSKAKPVALTNPPTVPTKHPVLVDGRETKALDSVLCLVNTAVLSHVGSYSGDSSSSTASSTKKSNGGLTLKAKKRIVQALDSPNANDFLKEICDFNVLLALDELLSSSSSKSKKQAGNSNSLTEETKVLCKLVRKWARGQKKGTVIDPKFKMKLKTYLS